MAIMWYGIQTYLASVAVNVMLLAAWPGLDSWTHHSFLGLDALGWVSFVSLWLIQAVIISQGMESVRKFQDFCGPAIWLVMIALAIWVLAKAGWSISLTSTPHPVSFGEQWRQWFGAIGLILATYGTLMLNFCDFSRFAPDYRTVRRGNFWGLPINSTAFVVVSVIVTAGSLEVWGQAITDPAELVAKVGNTWVMVLGAFTFAVATMGVNIVANFVSPAYDLANVWPQKITFKIGGMISTVAALVVTPWNLFSNPTVVNYFLGGLGAFLEPAVRRDHGRLLLGEARPYRRRRTLRRDPRLPLLLPQGRQPQGPVGVPALGGRRGRTRTGEDVQRRRPVLLVHRHGTRRRPVPAHLPERASRRRARSQAGGGLSGVRIVVTNCNTTQEMTEEIVRGARAAAGRAPP
ncbi:cytosine permease [Streptomyces sp. L7]